MKIVLIALSSAFLLMAGCNTVPPKITLAPTAAIDTSKEFYVTSNRQKEEVVAALRSAGLKTTDHSFVAGYQIEMRVGRDRRTFKCGALNSVYCVVTKEGRKVMEIRGRGKTGKCKPSIFDEIAEMIASQSGQ